MAMTRESSLRIGIFVMSRSWGPTKDHGASILYVKAKSLNFKAPSLVFLSV